MLNRKQVMDLAAVCFGILVAIGIYYVWPNEHWLVYVASALVAAGAFRTWPDLTSQGKILGGT
jgi:hypothetical protein